MRSATKPLFQVDPGWLFILAGLAVCAAGVILPAQNDLRSLQHQLEQLRAEEVHAYARLKAHSDFMDQVDRADPALVRRLAAAQLHMLPASDTPVLLVKAEASPVTAWIDNTVRTDIRPARATPISTLSTLANGPYRLWMFGGGIMSVFVGLLLNPGPARVGRLRWPGALWSFALGRARLSPDATAIIESKMVELPEDATSLEAEAPIASGSVEIDLDEIPQSPPPEVVREESVAAEMPAMQSEVEETDISVRADLAIETKLPFESSEESAVSDHHLGDTEIVHQEADDMTEELAHVADVRVVDPSEM